MGEWNWGFKAFLLVGLVWFICANSMAVYLANDIFQSDTYTDATKIVNGISIAYAVALIIASAWSWSKE